MAKSASTKARAAPERSRRVYVQKLIKKHETHARGVVVDDVERMVQFTTTVVVDAMQKIIVNYVKNSNTVKPNIAQAALQAVLSGDLRTSACTAGATALVNYTQLRKEQVEKAARKKHGGDAAVESAA
jgi:hypothetical protein